MRTLLAASIVAVVLSSSALDAQGVPAGAPAAPATARDKGWKVDSRLDVGAEYDGNVFLLPTGKKDNLDAPSAAELLSRRYTGMESAADVISTARGQLTFAGDGLGGRTLRLTPAVAYEFYARNAERRNVAVDLALEQDLRRDGRLRLRAGYVPTYYSRNYLTDAVDTDVDGSIAADERRYARGDYSALDLRADYRHRLRKSSRERPLGAFLVVGAGYADRTYDAPFTARDYSGPTGTLRLQLDRRNGPRFETAVDVAMLASPVRSQVVLLDEPVYGEDLNGNGNATDLNARAVRTTDRSRNEIELAQSARFDLGRRTEVELLVGYRWRTFTSDEPYDVANNGRRDRRLQVGVELERRLAKGLRLLAGTRYGSQQLNRNTDLGGEGAVDDYTKLQAHLGLRLTR